jgi:AAA+ ATPase superfamily predicted ATPase
MTVAKFMTQPDTLNDIGILVSKSFRELGKVGTKTFNILKFLLYDVTLMLQKLPFGNWVSIIYFIFMSTAIKNVVEGGELNRVLARAIQLYFIQQKSYSECLSRFQSYLWRIAITQIYEVQSFAYGVMVYAWDYTGGSVKREVKRFAKEVVLNNADDIEKTVKNVAKTAVFSAMVSAISQKLVSELGPVTVDAFSKSDIAKSIVDISDNVEATSVDISQISRSLQSDIQKSTDQIQILSSNLAESIAMLEYANSRGDENHILLNQKLAEISMQLEYLRVNQPTQFREIMSYVPISTLTDVLAKLTGTLSSSSTRRRIESV